MMAYLVWGTVVQVRSKKWALDIAVCDKQCFYSSGDCYIYYLYIWYIYIYTLHTWCGACCPMKSNPTNEISAVTQVAATKVIICIQTQYLKTHPWTTSLHHSFWFFNMFFNKCHSQYRNFSWGPDPNLGFDAQCAWDLDNPTGDSEALFDLPICYTEVWPLDQQQLWKWMLKLNEAPLGHLGGDGFF